ncbi:MAG TPA: hypothetical protein VFF68_08140 [Anaerolineaceae bacterium]|nr:hypothetical protein [Anaerolineaceae bacterium]
MEPRQIYELIGYIASVLVAISLMMSSILRLRLINLAGAVFFTAYGLLIRAYPVAAVNLVIILVNLYYLYEIFTAREYFQLMEVRPDSAYLRSFLAYYQTEIEKFLPGFRYDPARADLIFFVLRNMVPAGLFIGQVQGDRLVVSLDFVIPGYRDLKTGEFVFRRHADLFTAKGIAAIVSRSGRPAHERYLRRMGFSLNGELEGDRCYSLRLPAGSLR